MPRVLSGAQPSKDIAGVVRIGVAVVQLVSAGIKYPKAAHTG